jgi:hypothetical protein
MVEKPGNVTRMHWTRWPLHWPTGSLWLARPGGCQLHLNKPSYIKSFKYNGSQEAASERNRFTAWLWNSCEHVSSVEVDTCARGNKENSNHIMTSSFFPFCRRLRIVHGMAAKLRAYLTFMFHLFDTKPLMAGFTARLVVVFYLLHLFITVCDANTCPAGTFGDTGACAGVAVPCREMKVH